MNQAHFHLLLNHLPITIPIVGLLVLIAGMILRSPITKRIAYSIFVLGAILTMPAFATGEGAEEVVERLPGIDKKLIHAHEEEAEIFAIISYVLGVVSIGAYWASWKEKSFSNILTAAVILISLVALLFARSTGTTGGEIRHTEIRKDVSPT